MGLGFFQLNGQIQGYDKIPYPCTRKMLTPVPLTRDLVFVGGGHAHALVLRKWGMNPLPGARLTLINPEPTAPYTGMLPGHIAGHYSRETLEIDLMRLARFAGARLILSHATAIDRDARLIHVEGGEPIAYDVASIDIGITAGMNIPGFAQHAVGAKPLDRYAQAWRDFLKTVQSGEQSPTVAVIGGGVAGCELAMAMAFAPARGQATGDCDGGGFPAFWCWIRCPRKASCFNGCAGDYIPAQCTSGCNRRNPSDLG